MRTLRLESILLLGVRLSLTLVLLVPLIVNSPPLPHSFFPFVVGKTLYARVLIEIAFGLWIVLAVRSSEYRVPRSWILITFCIYLGIAFLASLFSVNPERSFWSTYERMHGFVDLVHWFAFVLVISSVLKSWTDWRAVLNFNLMVSVIIGLMGLAQANDIYILSYLHPTDRIGITFGNPTYVGAYMVVSVLIALGLFAQSLRTDLGTTAIRVRRIKRKRSKKTAENQGKGVSIVWWRTFWILAIILDIAVMLLSGSRGAVIALAAGLLVFSVCSVFWVNLAKVRLMGCFFIGLLLLVGVMFAIWRNNDTFRTIVSPSVTISRMTNAGLDDQSVKGRLNAAKTGILGVRDRPLLGWGPGNFTVVYDKYVTGDITSNITTSFDQAHNKPVEEFVTKGILGLMAYLVLWATLFWILRRRVKDQKQHDQMFSLFIGAALTGYFVQNLFLFDTPGTVVQLMLLVGYVIYLETAVGVKIGGPRRMVSMGSDQQGRLVIERSNFVFNQILITKLQTIIRRRLLVWKKVTSLKFPVVATVQSVIALLCIAVAIYFSSIRPYLGSKIILQTVETGITWTERLDVFKASIDAFPALANYPRMIMLGQLATHWDSLTNQEALTALELAENQGLEAVKIEPYDWRVRSSLASLYHRAVPLDPAYLGKAGKLVNQVAVMAPERLETQRLKAMQLTLEKDFDGAIALIDAFVIKYPESSKHLATLRSTIVEISKN